MFYVGQKVVCVDDDGLSVLGVPDPLTKGEEYTVVGTMVAAAYFHDNLVEGVGLFLAEIDSLSRPGMRGFPYFSERFRPRTNISVFTAMLDRQPTPETEDA